MHEIYACLCSVEPELEKLGLRKPFRIWGLCTIVHWQVHSEAAVLLGIRDKTRVNTKGYIVDMQSKVP